MATATAEQTTKTASGTHGPIVVDLGKASRKQIKRVRAGTGKLMDEVKTVLDDLKANGTLSATAQPVLIVVRRKRRKTTGMGLFG
jgi:hypothetical protein